MKEPTKTYVLYFSIGLNVALLAGILFIGASGEILQLEEESYYEERRVENHRDDEEEWRELENRLTRLERQTQSLRQKIARRQQKLLRALKDSATDTQSIHSVHDSIHRLQRNLQNRTLEILLEQRRTLSVDARRRVFNRLMKRHQQRYHQLYAESKDDEGDDDHEEYD